MSQTRRNTQRSDRWITCGERTKLPLQRSMDLEGCGKDIDRHASEEAWFVALNAFVQTGVYLCPACCEKHGIRYGRPGSTSPR